MERWLGGERGFWLSRESEPGRERRESSKEYEHEEEEGLKMTTWGHDIRWFLWCTCNYRWTISKAKVKWIGGGETVRRCDYLQICVRWTRPGCGYHHHHCDDTTDTPPQDCNWLQRLPWLVALTSRRLELQWRHRLCSGSGSVCVMSEAWPGL